MSADGKFSSTYPHRSATVNASAHSHYSGAGSAGAAVSSITGQRLSSSTGAGASGRAGVCLLKYMHIVCSYLLIIVFGNAADREQLVVSSHRVRVSYFIAVFYIMSMFFAINV